MEEGKTYRKKENGQDLLVNGLLDLLLIRTYLFQDDKAFVVFISLRDLFIVDKIIYQDTQLKIEKPSCLILGSYLLSHSRTKFT